MTIKGKELLDIDYIERKKERRVKKLFIVRL
jgi:hypothetical protein